jgi:hypothetical protein
MLPAGIAVMVVSTVVGVFALVVWALTSSTSRFAVRYALEAMYLVEPDEDASYYEPIASYYRADAPDLPAEQGPPDGAADHEAPEESAEQEMPEELAEHDAPAEPDAPAAAEQDGQSPRWVLALTAFQSGGLVLGMLMVMVGSIP